MHQWTNRRDPETLQYLLNIGADINATNDLGETVIMTFVKNMRNVTRNAYHAAQDNYTSFKKLFEAGSEIEARDNFGQTLLHHFASSLDRMAMTAPVREGDTQEPVVASTMESAVLCLNLLVSLGADSEAEDKEGKKPVDRFLQPVNSKRCLGGDLAGFFGFDACIRDGDDSRET